jgi:type I restriction enzyme, S subunit
VGKAVEQKQEVNRLPQGWEWKELGKCAQLINGRAYSQHELLGEGTPVIRIQNLHGGENWYYSNLELPPEKYCENGDLLFAWSTSFGPYIWRGSKSIFHYHIWKILLFDVLDKDFAFYLLQRITNDIKATSHGASMLHVTKGAVEKWKIPLPPLLEQKRIAEILSDRLSAVEKARAATEAQLAAAKALPAAYLRHVFDGPEAQKWKRKKLGEIALTVQNGIYKSSEYYGNGYPFLRMYNIKNSSWKLDFTTIAQVVLDDDELEKFNLAIGDLLVSRVNSFELVEKCGWVDSEAKGYVFENMLIRVRLINSIDSLFIAQQMGHRKIREQIQGVAKQAIGQASINSTDIRNIELLVPSLEIQKSIATELNEKTGQAEKLYKSLQSQLDTINQLPATLLRQAFNGEI